MKSSAQRLEESKCHSYLQEGQGGQPKELQAGQPHLDPWKGDGAVHPRNYFHAREREENQQEWSARIHQGEVTPDQPDKLLQ